MKLLKKAFALFLTGVFVIGSIGNLAPQNTYAAGGTSMEFGLQYSAQDFADTTFNGSDIFEVPEGSIGLFNDNIKNASSLDISITFKLGDSAGTYTSLLEISDKSNNSSSANSAQSTIAVIISKSGTVYFEAGSYKTSTDWTAATGTNIADGRFHSLKMSISSNKMVCQIDSGNAVTADKDSTDKKTKRFIASFFGNSTDGFTDWRSDINSITIGGLSPNSYFSHPNYSNLNGEISAISVSGVNNVSDITGGRVTTGMFDANIHDNTWLFGGGVETQGRFEEIGGIRNYIGHFEEYIRWVKRINSTLPGMQRYTINMGKAGQDAVIFAERLEEYITRVQPRAVSYLIGPEDYSKGEAGIPDFEDALSEIIDQSLCMKQNAEGNYDSYIVIQLPHAVKDAQAAQNISLYVNAAQDVIQAIAKDDADKADRILLVNHLTQTDNDTFKNTMLTDEGLLNSDGHYEFAKQFAQAVCGSVNGFPTISDSWEAEEAPETYRDTAPLATASADALTVTVPEDLETTDWHYILTINDTKITGTAFGNPFTIPDLPENEAYELIIQSKDGTFQLPAVAGRITADDEAAILTPTGDFQEKLHALLNQKDSVTWLFMGDSITHAAAHTHGYDGIAQIFEKYVKEDLKRIDDIVINTAVSGATNERTLENIEQRLTKYKPDIVSVMLGTNDTIPGNYKAGLNSILEKIRESNPDALIIFRSPTPAKTNAYKNKLPGENGSVALMKSAAEEDGNVLFIDQYTQWNEECTAYPYLISNPYYFGDGNVHPGTAGQLRMFRQFVQECGLNTNTKLANLSYQFTYAKETKNTQLPAVTIAEGKDAVTVSKAAVNEAYGAGEAGEITVRLTDSAGRSYEKSSGLSSDDVTVNIPANNRYTIKITANIKGSSARIVSFAEWDIPLILEEENDADLTASELVASQLDDITDYEDITEYIHEIEAIRTAYDNLTETQKLLIPNEKLKLLLNAENTINQAAADAINNRINNLKIIEDTNMYNAEVAAIRTAYTSLTETQKLLISNASMEKLLDAENKVEAAVNKQAADDVISKIKAIGKVENSADCGQRIAAARVAFDALTSKQQMLISNDLKKILQDAEEYYKKLQSESEKKDDPEKIPENFKFGNLLYKITNASELTAEVTGPETNAVKSVSIPASVPYNGNSYKITSIKASAFKNCKNLTSVVIGKNVEIIGSNAFAGCKKLKKVTAKSTALTKIGSKAFLNCKALKTIIIKSKSLEKVGNNAFKGIHKNASIKVPSTKLKPYVKILSKKGQGKKVKIKK